MKEEIIYKDDETNTYMLYDPVSKEILCKFGSCIDIPPYFARFHIEKIPIIYLLFKNRTLCYRLYNQYLQHYSQYTNNIDLNYHGTRVAINYGRECKKRILFPESGYSINMSNQYFFDRKKKGTICKVLEKFYKDNISICKGEDVKTVLLFNKVKRNSIKFTDYCTQVFMLEFFRS